LRAKTKGTYESVSQVPVEVGLAPELLVDDLDELVVLVQADLHLVVVFHIK
jgi:hypothetical protein